MRLVNGANGTRQRRITDANPAHFRCISADCRKNGCWTVNFGWMVNPAVAGYGRTVFTTPYAALQ